jgi:hypothetical protein
VVLRLMVGSNAGTAFGRTFGMAEAEVWVDDGGCHSWGRSKCRGLCYDEKIQARCLEMEWQPELKLLGECRLMQGKGGVLILLSAAAH